MDSATFIELTRQLYPTGLAFSVSRGTNYYALHEGLSMSESKALNDAIAVLFQVLPDNDNYTTEDATAWEEKLRIPIATPGVSLADRKAAILRKIRYPGDTIARQSAQFIESELNTAGFNVKVIANKFNGEVDAIKVGTGGELYNRFNIDTQFQAGTRFQKIAVDANATGVVISQLNQADENIKDQNRLSLRSCFIISGDPYPALANIPAAREREFRNLILTLKPAETHAFLFVNYI